MKIKKYLSALLMMGFLLSLIPLTGCSKDDDEEIGSTGGAVLTVNGKKWEATSLPVFEEDDFYFYGKSSDGYAHVIDFEEDLTDEDLEKGDDVSPTYVYLRSENAKYVYDDGDAIVSKCSSKEVTVRFDNLKVKYVGKWESILPDSREDDIVGDKYLTFNGTVTFHRL